MTKMLQCALVASLFALTGCNDKAEVVSPVEATHADHAEGQ